jgi:hypothetical protein
MRSLIDDQITQAGGSPREFRQRPLDRSDHIAGTVILTPIVGFLLFWIIRWLLELAQRGIQLPSWLSYAVVVLLSMALAGGAYILREVKQAHLYAVMEMGAGIAIAAQAATPGTGAVAKLLAVVAGVRIMVDGMTRYVKFRKNKERGVSVVTAA